MMSPTLPAAALYLALPGMEMSELHVAERMANGGNNSPVAVLFDQGTLALLRKARF